MSLILASSKLTENKSEIASEKPSSFTNFFRSPIEVEADSEIAVQSVKINRSGHVILKDPSFFAHYFGSERTTDLVDQDIYLSRTIRLSPGTYSLSEYTDEIQRVLNTQYAHPSINGRATVTLNTDVDGDEDGVKIQFIQRASGSGTSSIPQLTAVPAFQLGTSHSLTGPSSAYTWVSGTGLFTRTGADANTIANASCIGVLKGKPFSLTGGKCTFDSLTNASLGEHWCVGLTRPQIEASGDSASAKQIFRGPYSTGDASQYYDADDDLVEGVHNMSDYAVMCDDNNIIVLQATYDETKDRPVMKEVTYWGHGGLVTAKMTKTAFYASYDGVQFESFGDEILLAFKQKGKTVYDPVLNQGLSDAIDECFLPVGETKYALYPIINLGKGSLRVLQYESDLTDLSYSYPTYTISSKFYSPGSDMFSTESLHSLLSLGVRSSETVRNALSSGDGFDSVDYVDSQTLYWSEQPVEGGFTTVEYLGENASGGVAYSHILTIDKITVGTDDDTLSIRQRFPNMSYKLGYGERALLKDTSTDGYVTGTTTNTIVFTSTEEISKSNITSFIRVPNLTHKSFNGAQQSMSKILYQVPQFSNDGSEFGPLYFEPGEKTYVSLNNPAPMILNSLQVQFVGYDEKEINSLDGISQIMFHVRQKRK